jgi:hypothetical protein
MKRTLTTAAIVLLGWGLALFAQTQSDLTQIRNALLPVFVDSQVPAGTPNGTLTTFTLAAAPNPPASLHLYLNGLRQMTPGDATLSGVTITFISLIPQTGDTILVDYRH